jgi:hypothetical protein
MVLRTRSTFILGFFRCASWGSNGCDSVRAGRRQHRLGARHYMSIVRINAARRGSTAHKRSREHGRTNRGTRGERRTGANAQRRAQPCRDDTALWRTSNPVQEQGVARRARRPRGRASCGRATRRSGADFTGGLDTIGWPRAPTATTERLVLVGPSTPFASARRPHPLSE